MRDGPAAGLALVDGLLERGELADYHLAHAARADLCRRLGQSARPLSLVAAIHRQPAPCEQLETVRPPAAGDVRQLSSPGAVKEQLDRSVRLSGFEQDCGEPHRGPGRDEAFVKVARELEAFLCGGERDLQIADRKCDDRAVEEVPGKSRR